MPGTRKQRLQESLRVELSDVIRREMRDPRFTAGLLSITEVAVTADLKHAIVYVSMLGDEQARKDVTNTLRGAAHVLREELKRRRAFINVPELSFKYDEAMERGAHMYEVLERVKREDAEREQNCPHSPAPSPASAGEGEQKDNSYSPSTRLRERGPGGEGHSS